MGNKAIRISEQIQLLKNRGMIINDVAKAEEVLLDIGYYRLGFYWFPFEESYPNKQERKHLFKKGTIFEHIVKLYYFDFDLRNILLKFIYRIEINFRTFLIYTLSIEHPNAPTWFVDPVVVSSDYIDCFNSKVYCKKENIPALAHHHNNHKNDEYAPAWKTIEFMTLGEIIYLYKAIKSTASKRSISLHFGLKHPVVFDSYIDVIHTVRNCCAHGNAIYDIALPRSIRKGPADIIEEKNYQKLAGAIHVIYYMIGYVSKNRQKDFKNELIALFSQHNSCPEVSSVIKMGTGINNIENLFAE